LLQHKTIRFFVLAAPRVLSYIWGAEQIEAFPSWKTLSMMQAVFCNVSALAVASLFYYWRAYREGTVQREQVLRERVAHLLWSVAGLAD
jgi:hypothetical protein